MRKVFIISGKHYSERERYLLNQSLNVCIKHAAPDTENKSDVYHH